MTDNWRKLSDITAGIIDQLGPETFSVPLQPSLADLLKKEASKAGVKPETYIAEAVRAYLGDIA
jgi:hypothetical protein